MRNKIQFSYLLMLFTCWALGSSIAYAQCDATNFSVTATSGTCPANGNISVLLPGGPPCSGWQAILTNPGGLETVQNIPDSGGPINFSSLAAGDYNMRLINGATEIQYPGNPITITTSYQAMSISSTNTAPSCPNDANQYAPDGTLSITIDSGGIGPFIYEVNSQFGQQTFGPTTARSHVFGNMAGGEAVSFTVTDDNCTVSQTQNPVITDNTDAASEYSHATYQRKCAPDCTMYDVTFFTNVFSPDRINTIQLPGNATISINGGPAQDLTLINVNGTSVVFDYPPGLTENDSYVLNFNDGCYTFGESNSALPLDNSLLSLDIDLGYDATTCTTIHLVDAISVASNGPDTYTMFCPTNSIAIEQETSPGNWVNVPLVGGAGNPLSSGSFSNPYTLPGSGHYRLIATDDCHTVIEEFDTLPIINPLDEAIISNSRSILEGTGAFDIQRLPGETSGATIPSTTYEINPVPFVPSITINPAHPFSLAGSYTLNFPIIYNTTINRTIIGDLPPGDYEITATDICGNQRIIPYTISTADLAQYSPNIQPISGCANSGSIVYDMNPSAQVARALLGPTVAVELWTDDGAGGLGTLVQGDIPPDRYSGSFPNLSAGDYLLRFLSINFESTNNDEVFSAATLSNVDREYLAPATIAPYQSITAATAGAFCDLNDASSGIIYTEITGGTPTYPMTYELFETSNPGVAVQTHTETNISVTDHLFQNVPEGDYIVRVTSPCDGIDLNLNMTLAPIVTTILADNNPICAPGDVQLSINLPTSIFDITWTDDQGNNVGTGSPITVSVSAPTTYTASYSLRFCVAAPVNTNNITVDFYPTFAQVGPESPSCNAQGTFYTLEVELTGTPPYTISGTGAPGTFNGNIWTSDPIPAGTDYNMSFGDPNLCNSVVVVGNAPNCCVLLISLPVSDIDLCLNPGPFATTISNSFSGHIYEVLDENGNSFVPPLTGIGNGGDLSISIPTPPNSCRRHRFSGIGNKWSRGLRRKPDRPHILY